MPSLPEKLQALIAKWRGTLSSGLLAKHMDPQYWAAVNDCLIGLESALSESPDVAVGRVTEETPHNTALDIALATSVMGWKECPDGDEEALFADDAPLPYVIEYAERCVLMHGSDHEDWEVWSPTGNREHAKELIEKLSAQPAAPVVDGWIPCSERMPERGETENTWVLAWSPLWLRRPRLLNWCHSSIPHWRNESDDRLYCDVTHWRELPPAPTQRPGTGEVKP